jgi:hypothetical protein
MVFCLTGTTRGFLGLDRGIRIFLGFISKFSEISTKYFRIVSKFYKIIQTLFGLP